MTAAGVKLGAPYMHKVGAFGLQKRRKGGSVAHDAVMHAVRGAVGILFAHAEHGQVQIGAGAQRQLPGQPAAADIAGFGQPAGSRRLRQGGSDKPKNIA